MKRILVIATRQIGDVLLTTALIRAARERWPGVQVEVLGFAGTLDMLRGNPDVSLLLESPPRLGWSGFCALVQRLWRGYDLALITQPGDRAHLIGWLASRQRSGIVPESGGSNWWKKALLQHVVRSAGDRGDVHAVAEKLALLDPWPLPDACEPQVVPPQQAALPADVQQQLRPGAIVLHAPSMWRYKQWPLAHFRELAAALLGEGRQVILTGSGSARDQECVAALKDLADPPQLLDVSGLLDFNQLSALFGQAALYIGPDTSVTHLAAAAGIPVIAIFGPTNPVRWGPWPVRPQARAPFERSMPLQTSGNVSLLQAAGLRCVPCGRAGCENHLQSRSDCLVAITPGRVLQEARRLLED